MSTQHPNPEVKRSPSELAESQAAFVGTAAEKEVARKAGQDAIDREAAK